MSHYEIPQAIEHDAGVLVNDARALLEATSEVADQKVVQARERLSHALERARGTAHRVQERLSDVAKQADVTVRDHPYETLAVAFGAGALLAGVFYALFSRRA